MYCAELGYTVPCDYLSCDSEYDYCDTHCGDKQEPSVACWMQYAREVAKNEADKIQSAE